MYSEDDRRELMESSLPRFLLIRIRNSGGGMGPGKMDFGVRCERTWGRLTI